MNTHIVNSVSEFLKVIEDNNIQSNLEKKIYFRGITDKSWLDEPSIYRSPNKPESEHNIYHEMISRIPQEFKDCHTAFDHLVKMQHYGLPTRLLDITSDPLVALFFACNSHKDKDGKVIIYNISATDVKTYDSDTVSIIANLAKIRDINLLGLELLLDLFHFHRLQENMISFEILPNKEFIGVKNRYKNLSSIFIKIMETVEKELESHLETETDDDLILFYQMDLKHIQELIDQLNKDSSRNKNNDDFYVKEINDNFYIHSYFNKKIITPFRRFVHCIKAEKPYFDSTQMNFEHISSVQCVEPKKDNPRIIKQNGAFLIFGMANFSDSKEKGATIPEEFYFTNQNKNKIEIIIPPSAKGEILTQLKMLSISESTLFPEADKIAKEIKESYEMS